MEENKEVLLTQEGYDKLEQIINAKIIGIDKEKMKIGLSIKELEGTSAEYGYEQYIKQAENK